MVVVVLVVVPAAVDEVGVVVVLPGVEEVDPGDAVVVVVRMDRRCLAFTDRWHTNGKERVHSWASRVPRCGCDETRARQLCRPVMSG